VAAEKIATVSNTPAKVPAANNPIVLPSFVFIRTDCSIVVSPAKGGGPPEGSVHPPAPPLLPLVGFWVYIDAIICASTRCR
jgi:hypothetical protein